MPARSGLETAVTSNNVPDLARCMTDAQGTRCPGFLSTTLIRLAFTECTTPWTIRLEAMMGVVRLS